MWNHPPTHGGRSWAKTSMSKVERATRHRQSHHDLVITRDPRRYAGQVGLLTVQPCAPLYGYWLKSLRIDDTVSPHTSNLCEWLSSIGTHCVTDEARQQLQAILSGYE